MQSVILYPTDAGVAVVNPAPEMGDADALQALASQVVPEGLPFRIMERGELPDAPPDQWRWSDEGPLAVAPPDPTFYAAAIDGHVEVTARLRGYNGAASLASYAVSTVPAWRADATAFVAWRDRVWLAAYDLMARIKAGAAKAPDDIVATLPVIDWPK